MNEAMHDEIENVNTNPGAIILAAGLGERLQAVGLKPFLLWRGKSFLEIAVEHARSIRLYPIVIVTNEIFYNKIVELNLPAKTLLNPHPENGMLSSIRLGLHEIESACSGAFLCAIDHPLVQQATFHKLWLAHRSHPNQIIMPAFNSQTGHPVVFPKNLFLALREAPLVQGARFVIRKYSHLIKIIVVDDPGILININTPELYCQHCK